MIFSLNLLLLFVAEKGLLIKNRFIKCFIIQGEKKQMTDPQDTTMGTVALIFGILGCIGILPCIGALIAVITGSMSKGTAGDGNGKIGRILGWLGILIPIIGTIIYVILALLYFGFFWVTT